MSSTPTIFDLCEPRPDVRAGTAMDSDFAADLARVLRGDAPPDYADPALFFANTHPTRGLQSLLSNVCGRLSGGGPSVAAVFRLDTSFGGGKTHGLIALVHAARGMAGVANPSEFINPALLPRGRVRIAAFTGENSDPINGRRMGTDGTLAHTPWGEIAYDLAGPEGFARVRASDQAGVAPGAETIAELFGTDPTLILLDELAVYLRRVWARPSARDQLTAFLTALFKAVESSPNVALVYTLAVGTDGIAGDAYSDQNRFVADQMAEARSVSARKATLLNPTEDDETVHVLRRRLFARVGDPRAAGVVAAYRDTWSRNRESLTLDAAKPATAEALAASYPFHPEVLETLTAKTATLNDFQRVRGMLRILGRTIGKLWADQPPDAMAIHLHHIDPGFEPIRQEITTRLGQSMYVPAIRSDIAGEGTALALAQEIDASNHAGLPPYAAYVARTVFMHSLAFNDALRGLTPERLRYSIAGPLCDVSFIEEARKAFLSQSAYLDDRPGAPMRFMVEANLTQLIRREEAGVDPQALRDELRDRIREVFKGGNAPVLNLIPYPSSPFEVPDEVGEGRPLLVLLSPDACTVGATVDAVPDLIATMWERKGSDSTAFRIMRNNLMFLAADEAEIEPMRAAMASRIALRDLKAGPRLKELAEHQRDELLKRESASESRVVLAIQGAFRHLFYPAAAGVPGGRVPLAHRPIPNPSTSERPGAGQVGVVRELRAANKLRTAEDQPDEPRFVRDKTQLRRGQITTAALRQEFRENHALPILVGDDVFRRGVRQGVERGEYVYRRGDLLYGKDDPAPSIALDEEAVLFTMAYALEQRIWPRQQPKPDVQEGQDSEREMEGATAGWIPSARPSGCEDGTRATTDPGVAFNVSAGMSTAAPRKPDTFTAEGPLRQALADIFTQARSAKAAALASLRIRIFDVPDGFKLLGGMAMVRVASVHVGITGEYETKAGSTVAVEFGGTPADALPVRDFLVPQCNASDAKEVTFNFSLTFADGLPMSGDTAAKLSDHLTRFATGAAYVEAAAEATIPA